MIDKKTSVVVGPRRSLRPTVTNDNLPFGMRTNDPLVAREKRPTSTNDNRSFFAISFGLMRPTERMIDMRELTYRWWWSAIPKADRGGSVHTDGSTINMYYGIRSTIHP